MIETTNLLTKENDEFIMKFQKRTKNNISEFYFNEGVIYDKTTNNIVCPGLTKLSEISALPDKFDLIKEHAFFKDVELSNCRQYSMHDGTIIRLFYHNNKWNKATNRCINADNSSFGFIESFGKLFDNISKEQLDYTKLNKNYCYSFILQSPDNRIIEPASSFSNLIHIETYDKNTNKYIEEDIGIMKPLQYNYTEIDTLLADLNNQDMITWQFPGFILINSRNEKLKLENPQYTYVKDLKGNIVTNTKSWTLNEGVDPMMYRYLSVMVDREETEFLYYFPEYTQGMVNMKLSVYNLAKDIWETYKQRFIMKNKEYPQNPKYKTFLNVLHSLYMSSYMKNSFRVVHQVVKEAPVFKLLDAMNMITVREQK